MLAYNSFFWTVLVTLTSPWSVAGLMPYQHFFPERRQALAGLLNGNCSKPYDAFLKNIPAPVTDPLIYWKQRDPGWAVINCLLSAAPEGVKADFSSAQVILGLMPSVLGSLGPSSQELSLLLVLGNRQFLALCLALGSPFTNGDHSFDFPREIKSLPRHNDGGKPFFYREWRAGAPFLYFQYFIVFAAIANIAELSYEFAQSAPSTIMQQTPNYLPGLMAVVGFTMHLLVAFAFRLCVKIEDNSTRGPSQQPAWKRWTNQQLGAIDEDSLSCVELNTANTSYTISSWLAKVAIITHIGWHIVAFSTVLFVSSQDAVVLLFRYFASVCICRMVAANEINVLGKTVKRNAKTQPSQSSVCTLQGAKDTTPKIQGGSG